MLLSGRSVLALSILMAYATFSAGDEGTCAPSDPTCQEEEEVSLFTRRFPPQVQRTNAILSEELSRDVEDDEGGGPSPVEAGTGEASPWKVGPELNIDDAKRGTGSDDEDVTPFLAHDSEDAEPPREEGLLLTETGTRGGSPRADWEDPSLKRHRRHHKQARQLVGLLDDADGVRKILADDLLEECCQIVWVHGFRPHETWGSTPQSLRSWGDAKGCNSVVGGWGAPKCREVVGVRSVVPNHGSIMGATPITIVGNKLHDCHGKVLNTGSVSSLQPQLRIFVVVGLNQTIECPLEQFESRPDRAKCVMPSLPKALMNVSDIDHPVIVMRRRQDGSYATFQSDKWTYKWSTGATPAIESVQPQVAGPGDVLKIRAWGCDGIFEYSPIDLVQVRTGMQLPEKKEQNNGTLDGGDSELVDDGEEAFGHVCEKWPNAMDEADREKVAVQNADKTFEPDLPATTIGNQGVTARLWTWPFSDSYYAHGLGDLRDLDKCENFSVSQTYDRIWLAELPRSWWVMEGGHRILPWYAGEENVNFLVSFDGYMHVKEGGHGTYEFNMECSGSCRIKIDNKQLIDSLPHDARTTNQLTLAVGWHRLQVLHANRVGRWAYTRTLNNNDRLLQIWYKGPDTNMEMVELPATVLRTRNSRKILEAFDREAQVDEAGHYIMMERPSKQVPQAAASANRKQCPSGEFQRLYEFSCKVSGDMEPGFYDVKVHDHKIGASTESLSARWSIGMGAVSATLRIVPKVERVSLLPDGRLHVRGAGLDHLPAARENSSANATITYGDRQYRVTNVSQDHLDLAPDIAAPGTATRLGSRGIARQVWLQNRWPVEQISLGRASQSTRATNLRTALEEDEGGSDAPEGREGFAERLRAVLMPPHTGECRFRVQGTQMNERRTLNEAKLYLADSHADALDRVTFPSYPIVYTHFDEERVSRWMRFEKDRGYPLQLERRLGVPSLETGDDGWKMLSFECKRLEGEGAALLPSPIELFRIRTSIDGRLGYVLTGAEPFDIVLHNGRPEVYIEGDMHPVCGHYFWDFSNAAAQTICASIGESGGRLERTRFPLPRNGARFNRCHRRFDNLSACGPQGVKVGGLCAKGDRAGITITCENGVRDGASPNIQRRKNGVPVVTAELRKWPAWTEVLKVHVGTRSIAVNVGRAEFNSMFHECPVVKYTRDGGTSMVYVRITPFTAPAAPVKKGLDDLLGQCCQIVWDYGLRPHESWGSTPHSKRSWWDSNGCNSVVGDRDAPLCETPSPTPAPTPAPTSASEEPWEFDAYEAFTQNWPSHPGTINVDYMLFPTVDAAQNKETDGNVVCTGTAGGGFPGACSGSDLAFKMPEHGSPNGVSKDAGLEIQTSACLSPMINRTSAATATFSLTDSQATIGQKLSAAGMPSAAVTVVSYNGTTVLDLESATFLASGDDNPEKAVEKHESQGYLQRYASAEDAMANAWLMVKLLQPVHVKSIKVGGSRMSPFDIFLDDKLCGRLNRWAHTQEMECDGFGSSVKFANPQTHVFRVFDLQITVFDQNNSAADEDFGILVKYDTADADRIIFGMESEVLDVAVHATTKSSGSRIWSSVTDYWFRMPHMEEQVIFGNWRDYICFPVDQSGCAPVHVSEPPETPPSLLQSHAGRQHASGARRMPQKRWRLPHRYHTSESLELLRRRVFGEASRPAGWTETEALLQKYRSGKHRHERDGGPHDPREDANTSAHLRWSDPSSWGGEEPPNKHSTDIVLIPEGMTAVLDMNVFIKFWVIEGNLVWDLEKDLVMEAECIIVNGGQLLIGSKEKPYTKRGEILFHGHWHSFKLPLVGTKGLFETRGLIEIFGKPIDRTWVELNTTAYPGEKHLKLRQKVDWLPGSLIVVAPSDAWPTACRLDRRDDCQAEERYVQKVDDDGMGIRMDRPLVYRHVSEEHDPHFPADYCDEHRDVHPEYCQKTQVRAEVGLLTRNILVKGANYDDGTGPPGSEGYGAHLMNSAQAKYSHVEFYWVGQAFQQGRYALHFHLSGMSPTSYIDGCSIRRSFNRGITIHGTHNMTVKRNVVYSHMGHGFFIEDGTEHGNLFQDNLGLLTMVSMSMQFTDMAPATFWMKNPQNNFIGNHAAGSCSKGMWWDSQFRELMLGEVRDNVMHTNPTGIWLEIDSRKDCYSPDDWTVGVAITDSANIDRIVHRSPPQCTGPRQLVHFNSTTSWGNGNGMTSWESGHVHYRNWRGVCDGFSLAISGHASDHWPDPTNGFDGPTIMHSAFHSRSQLNSAGFFLKTAVGGGWDDGLFITGAQFVGQGFTPIATCINCLPAEGGYQIRTSKLGFWDGAGSHGRVSFPWPFASYLFDVDGTLTTQGTNVEREVELEFDCRTSGCYLHSPMGGGMYSQPGQRDGTEIELVQEPEMQDCYEDLTWDGSVLRDGVGFSASSEIPEYTAENVGMDTYWVAAHQDAHQWFQVDFGTTKWIHGVSFKGRNNADHWVLYYRVSYSEDGSNWTTLPRHLKGNVDRHHAKENLWVPVRARLVRILIDEWNRYISLRDLRFRGCDGSVNLTTICVDKAYIDDLQRNCRELQAVRSGFCESDTAEMHKWTAHNAKKACCFCGGGEPLSISTPQEEGEAYFIRWGSLAKYTSGGTAHLPPDLCQWVDGTGGIVCDHRTKLRTVTIDKAGNWEGMGPITIQTDYGFTTAIYIDCYKDYEFSVFDGARVMAVPPYTPSLLVDWNFMHSAVDMEEGDKWVLQIETIHNPAGYRAGQEGIKKVALCDEGLRNPAEEQTAEFTNDCDPIKNDCNKYTLFNCHGDVLIGPRYDDAELENDLASVKTQNPALVASQIGGTYYCTKRSVLVFGPPIDPANRSWVDGLRNNRGTELKCFCDQRKNMPMFYTRENFTENQTLLDALAKHTDKHSAVTLGLNVSLDLYKVAHIPLLESAHMENSAANWGYLPANESYVLEYWYPGTFSMLIGSQGVSHGMNGRDGEWDGALRAGEKKVTHVIKRDGDLALAGRFSQAKTGFSWERFYYVPMPYYPVAPTWKTHLERFVDCLAPGLASEEVTSSLQHLGVPLATLQDHSAVVEGRLNASAIRRFRWSEWPDDLGGRPVLTDDTGDEKLDEAMGYGNITIQTNWEVTLDLDVDFINKLNISGVLKFADEEGCCRIVARYIFVGPFVGRLEAGTAEKPFTKGHAHIILKGHPMTPYLKSWAPNLANLPTILRAPQHLGAKYLAVQGTLSLFGSGHLRERTWGRLKQSVSKGSTTVLLDGGSFRVGDTVSIDRGWEILRVTNVAESGDGVELTFDNALSQDYLGLEYEFSNRPETKGWMHSVIGVVDGHNIVLEGEDTPGVPMCSWNDTHVCPYASGLPLGTNLHDWAKEARARPNPNCRPCLAITDMGFGGKILTMGYMTSYSHMCPKTHGLVQASGVAFKHVGPLHLYHNYERQINPFDFSYSIEWGMRPHEWWADPLWEHELLTSISVGSHRITKNAFNQTKCGLVVLDAQGFMAGRAMDTEPFTQNVFLTSFVSPKVVDGAHMNVGGFEKTGRFETFSSLKEVPDDYFKFIDNFFSGMEFFCVPGVSASRNFFTNTMYIYANFNVLNGIVANGCRDNIVQGPTASGQCIKTGLQGLAGVADNVVHSCGVGIMFEDEYSSEGVVTRMNILNCRAGVTYHGRHKYAGARSPQRRQFLIENTNIYSNGGDGFGINNPHVHSSLAWNPKCCPRSDHSGCAVPPFKPLGGQALFFKSYITNVKFVGFKRGRAIAHGYGAHQQGDSDVHPIYIRGLQFEDMGEDARLFVRGAHSKGFGIKQCLSLECGGNRNMLIHDLDGSLTGDIGTVIPGYDKFWDKLHYASPLGFENPEDLIPFAQRYDQVGNAIPFPKDVDHGTGGDLVYECKANSTMSTGEPGCDVLFMNGPGTPNAGYWTPNPGRAAGLAPSTRIIATREDGGLIRLDPIHHGWNYATGWVMTNRTTLLEHYKDIPKPESQHARRYGRVGPNEFGTHINTSRINATKGPVYTKAGIYREGCNWREEWNAYTCAGGRHFHLVIEVLDVDVNARRFCPVTVEVNDDYAQQGGYLNMLTEPANTGLGLLQTFWALGHTNMRHNIYFTSDPPRHVRLHYDGPEYEAIVFMMYYGVPNNIVGYVDGKRVEPIAVVLWDNPVAPELDGSMPHGTYYYDRVGMESGRPGYLYGVLRGQRSMDFKIIQKIILTTKVNASTHFRGWEDESGDNFYNKGTEGLTRNLAFLIGAPPSRVAILGEGSARPGTFWNEETTSKEFAEWMHQQNKSLSDWDREAFLDEYMKKVSNTSSELERPHTPDDPSFLQHHERERRHLEFLQRFPAHRHAVISGALSRYGSSRVSGDRFLHQVGLLSSEEMEAVAARQSENLIIDQEEMGLYKLANMQLTKERQAVLRPKIKNLTKELDVTYLDIEVEEDDNFIGQTLCVRGESTSCAAIEDDQISNNQQYTEEKTLRVLRMLAHADNDASLLQKRSRGQSGLFRAQRTVANLLREEGVEITRTTVDNVPRMGLPIGWLCPAPSYNDGSVCDCECGIWDPDCDVATERHTVGAIWDAETSDIRLFDSHQVSELFKRTDWQFNRNSFIDGRELLSAKGMRESALKALAAEISHAEASSDARSRLRYGNFATLEAVRAASCNTATLDTMLNDSLAEYSPVCVRDSEFTLLVGAATGRCELLPKMKIGSQCSVKGGSGAELSEGSTVCGSNRRCVASEENTWDYECE